MADEIDDICAEILAAKLPEPARDCSFFSLAGKWHVRGKNLRSGDVVEVSKRDGSKSKVRIEIVSETIDGDWQVATFSNLLEGKFRR